MLSGVITSIARNGPTFVYQGVKVGDRKPQSIALALIPLILVPGLAGPYRVTQSPSFEAYRGIDVVRLVTIGAFAGVVMVILGRIVVHRHDPEQPVRRRLGPLVFIGIVVIGMIPRDLELYRAVDVVQLTGSGACFGVALAFVGMMIGLRASRT